MVTRKGSRIKELPSGELKTCDATGDDHCRHPECIKLNTCCMCGEDV